MCYAHVGVSPQCPHTVESGSSPKRAVDHLTESAAAMESLLSAHNVATVSSSAFAAMVMERP